MKILKRNERLDFTTEDPWRIFRIMSEFVEGFDELSKIGPAVTIFGSARTKLKDKYYKLARKTASLLVKNGYAVITGAGPGIMEAANRGASESGGESIGLNIQVPIVQRPNRYVKRLLEFRYFFCRKVMFAKYAKAFILFPGGFGTMDEFFEAITLIQTKRVNIFPVILIGSEFWGGLIDWMKTRMLEDRKILPEDLKLFQVIDEPEEAVKIIKRFYGP